MLRREAGVVAADQIPPAVRAFAHRVAAVLGETKRKEFFGRAVGLAVAVAVTVAREPAIAAEIEIVSVKTHSHTAGFGLAKQRGLVRLPVTVCVFERFDP